MNTKVLSDMIAYLQGGGEISRLEIKRRLGDQTLVKLDAAWEEEKKSRNKKPREILCYSKMLHEAHWQLVLAHRCSDNCSPKAIIRKNRAFAKFKSAVEYLDSVVASDPSLASWLDRPIDGGIDSDLSSIPRPVWSKSVFANSNLKSIPARSLREVKIDVLEEERLRLEEIGNGDSLGSGYVAQKEILDAFNNRHRSVSFPLSGLFV
jgi:hypothetical protein